MKIGIAGNGIIGGALRRYLEVHTKHEILIYDPPQGLIIPLYQADAIFVSVPVITKGFKQDLSIIKEVLRVCPRSTNVPIFLRSSVLPGTADKLSEEFGLEITAFPEFLTERTAAEDFTKAKFHIAGGHGLLLSEIMPHKEFSIMTNSEAEMVKFTHNCFAATKVTFFNGIYDLCQKHDINYEVVKTYVPEITGFISPAHMEVPGPDGKRGFGGACFPSNLAALMGLVGNDAFYMLLEKVWTLNCVYRETQDFPNIGK